MTSHWKELRRNKQLWNEKINARVFFYLFNPINLFFINEVLEVNDVSLKRKEEINNDETKRLIRVFLYLFNPINLFFVNFRNYFCWVKQGPNKISWAKALAIADGWIGTRLKLIVNIFSAVSFYLPIPRCWEIGIADLKMCSGRQKFAGLRPVKVGTYVFDVGFTGL